MLKSRKYQQDGIDQLRTKIKEGKKRLIYWLATGGGKGFVMSQIAFNALESGKKVIVVMRRRSLIFQTRDNFKKYHNIDSSVIMGNEKGFTPKLNCQIASIDTIQKRIYNQKHAFLKDYDLVICDEMHDSRSTGYMKFFSEFVGKIFIGFSATPFHVGNKGHTFWEDYVQPVTPAQLRDMGYLVPVLEYKKDTINMRGARRSGGDFMAAEIMERSMDQKIVGSVVENYLVHGDDRPALLFCSSREHARAMRAILESNDIPAGYTDGEDSKAIRDHWIHQLKTRQIKILCSIGTLTTGVDIPFVELLIMLRPTMSEILFVQMIGRGLRPYKICSCGQEYGGDPVCPKCGSDKPTYEKQNCKIFDHSGNFKRHGLTYNERQIALTDRKKKESDSMDAPSKSCNECGYWMPTNTKECPECGHDNKSEQEEKKQTDGTGLLELVVNESDVLKTYRQLLNTLRYKPNADKDYIFKELHKRYGLDAFKYVKITPPTLKRIRKNELLSQASRLTKKNLS